MNAQHTPGPWEWDGDVWQDNGFECAPWLVQMPCSDADRKIVLSGSIRCDGEANARLIAAAPDLLEAAKLVLAWYEAEENSTNADRPNFYERVEMCRVSEDSLRAAIAKATGEQP